MGIGDQYVSLLNQGNIKLFDTSDRLVWAYNKREGQVTARLIVQTSLIGGHNGYGNDPFLKKFKLNILAGYA